MSSTEEPKIYTMYDLAIFILSFSYQVPLFQISDATEIMSPTARCDLPPNICVKKNNSDLIGENI